MFRHPDKTQGCHSERSEEPVKTAREAVPNFAAGVFRHLLWKEWRENLWKLTFGGAVSMAFVLLLFRIRLFPDSQNCIIISFVQMLALPVIYALDIFSGEMSNRTIHLLFKFPVPRWKIFFSKYLISISGMVTVFLISGLLMELISQGREAEIGYLFRTNLLYAVSALLLFSWFCTFGAQSRSEAGSLVAMFGVLIGWGIIYFSSITCEWGWLSHFAPYLFTIWIPGRDWISSNQLIISQGCGLMLSITIGCYRFVKVRRYL